MKAVLLLSVLVVSAMCFDIQTQLMKDLFQQWKLNHNKRYVYDFEETFRFNAFSQNYLDILEFNSKDDSVTLALNQFADLTTEEFGALYTGTFFQPTDAETIVFNDEDLPTSVDWRDQGAVTPVKNQGQCGSCWAFSATGALEGLNFLNSSSLLSFSEQQLVDCVTADQGCNGGLPIDAFAYTADAGIESEDDYPYKGVDGKCNVEQSKIHKVNTGYANVTVQSADQLKAALVGQPVSIGIQANQLVFQFYAGGVIKRFCGDTLDHGVLAVGYDTIKGDEAYIVKNSWGATWGNSGYVYISTDGSANQGNGVCGILMMPTIPVNNA